MFTFRNDCIQYSVKVEKPTTMDLNSESDQMSSEEEVRKEKKSKKKSSKKNKHKKSKKKSSKKSKHRSSSSESGTGDEDEWVEKNVDEKIEKKQQPERDDWMTSSNNFLLPTFSKEQQKPKEKDDKNYEKYDPKSSTRELNPYWKTGEGGLPSFQKPKDNDDNDEYFSKPSKSSGNWRKSNQEPRKRSRSKSPSPVHEITERSYKPQSNPENNTASHSDFLTDAQMNDIGAKMIKAEIMGNTTRYDELKDKLDKAKAFKNSRKAGPQSSSNEGILLTLTNPATGTSRPISQKDDQKRNPQDRRNKKKRAETHLDGERTKYYADDDKYDIKQMVRNLNYIVIQLIFTFFFFSLNVRNFLMEQIRILSLLKQLLRSKTMTKWIWQISFQTLYAKMQNKRTNVVKPLESIIAWKKYWILVINVLNHQR